MIPLDLKNAILDVEVDPECKQAFDDVRMGSKYRYVVYKIDEGNGKTGKIMIDKVKIFKAYNETCSYFIRLFVFSLYYGMDIVAY